MRINRIRYFNYKPFYLEQTIEVPNNGKIVVIRGENGAGKTTIIQSLPLCLYQERVVDWNEHINAKALYEAVQGADVCCYIQINFEHEGKGYIIKRGCEGKKLNDGTLGSVKDIYTLDILKPDATSECISEGLILNHINAILNVAVKDYFFFDGAEIVKFTVPDHSSHVQSAIQSLLKIEAIRRAKKNLEKVVAEIRCSIKGDSPEDGINILNKEIEVLEKQKESQQKDIENIDRELKSIDKMISKTSDEIESIKMNSAFEQQLKKLEDEINQITSDINKCTEELHRALKVSYLCFADKLMIDATKEIKQNSNTLVSPGAIREIIKETLEGTCYICGSVVTEEIKERLLLKLPSIINEKSNAEEMLNLLTSLTETKNIGISTFTDISNHQGELNILNAKLTRLQEEYKTYEESIDNDLPDYNKHLNILIIMKQKRDEKISDKAQGKWETRKYKK